MLVPKIDFENGVIDPDHHREISTQHTKLRLDLAYGITSRVSVFGVLPLFTDKSHEHFDDVGTSGFGDVAVGAHDAFLVNANDLLVGSVSVKLPTGA